jgi:toxin ParE1/3/4
MLVRWTSPAANDLTQICDYISERADPATARRVALSVFDTVTLLAEFPERGRMGRKSGTRELVFSNSPYLAVYRITGEAVEILRILHGAQKWP